MRIALGSKVKDKVTGLKGMVVSRHEYLNGCWRYGVQPTLDKDGKIPDAYYIDEMQLEVVEEPKAVKKGSEKTGGPRSNPRSFSNPR